MRDLPGFIERFGLWTDEERRQAEALKQRLAKEDVRLIRLAWADPHGASRAKMLSVPALIGGLEDGYNINVSTTTLDSANARTFSSFTRGGGMNLEEMTGSPNLTLVPDPATFRMLPWAPGVGWILADEYFNNGVPFYFSPRQLLKKQLKRLADRDMGYVVGIEIEWYLLRVAESLGDEHVGSPGTRPRPLATAPVEPGYSYHSESNMDLMQPVLSALADGYEKIGLPLRSIENEWGPGQVECTLAAQQALQAADDAMLFRTATKQICRRLGYMASFMCRPGLRSYYSSGWHLHQSVTDGSGRNLFMPDAEGACLSPLGLRFLGGILDHAAASVVFTTPTVNGYRRFRANSLAPDRASWGYDHRGAMLRVLGGVGDRATRLENRVGEPAANPYLYMASQIASGLDGIAHETDPGPQEYEPYAADHRPLLPSSLNQALDLLEASPLFRTEFGEIFIDYFLKLKRNEAGRFTRWLEENEMSGPGDEVTGWEQNEYFDFF